MSVAESADSLDIEKYVMRNMRTQIQSFFEVIKYHFLTSIDICRKLQC